MDLIRKLNYELPTTYQFQLSLIIFSSLLFFIFLLWLLHKFLNIRVQLKRNYVIVEVKPTEVTLQSNVSTEKFFTTIHSLTTHKTFTQRVLGIKDLISLEIASTKNDGIRYILRIPKEDFFTFKNILTAFLPGVSIKEIQDYLPDDLKLSKNHKFKVFTLGQKNNFIFPLENQTLLKEYDPIAYITNQMTNLKEDELVSIQLVITPVTNTTHKGIIRKINSLRNLSKRGFSIINPRKENLGINLFLQILGFCLSIIFSFLDIIVSNRNNSFNDLFSITNTRKFKDLSQEDKAIQNQILDKLSHELFESTIRIIIISKSNDDIVRRKQGILSSFATLSNDSNQYLTEGKSVLSRLKFFQKYNYFCIKRRLLKLKKNSILSVSEISSIYHFPFTSTTKTEDILKVKSFQLPAPLRFKQSNNEIDIKLGVNNFSDKNLPIGLTKEERRRHVYAIGATGSGKTTMLSSMIYQDIVNGNGLAVIDPHGDLTQKLVKIIPEDRINDVIIFNPDDTDFPCGVNLLQIEEGLNQSEAQKQKDFITSSIISIFSKLYPPKYFGPRMEYILRNSILTSLETKDPTLFTIHKLLTDERFRKEIIIKIKDKVLKDFWINEFETLGDYQRNEVISPITNKIGRFLTSPLPRNILSQKKNTINIADIMDSKKILICDLSKGKIGEDNSSFFGSIILAQIQLAALKRVRIPEEERVDFYLYVDEFQNFATPSFAEILSEARKYRLNAILAHQTVSQIEDINLLKTILANSGTIVSFRTSNPSDENLILPIFSPQVQKHDISNLPSFRFYVKIQTLESENAFTGETEKLNAAEDTKVAEKIIAISRKNYSIPRINVEKEIFTDLNKQRELDTKKLQERRIF